MDNLDITTINQLFLNISHINSLEQLLVYLEEIDATQLEIKKVYTEYYYSLKQLVYSTYYYQKVIQKVNYESENNKSEKYEYEVIYNFYKKYCKKISKY